MNVPSLRLFLPVSGTIHGSKYPLGGRHGAVMSCQRCFVAVLALLALAACGSGGGADSGATPAIRHVIMITLDTTRADHLGCYGNPSVKTLALDQLAREGVLFEACQSAAATTLSSHVSMMTGTYPHLHGVPRNGFTVSEKNLTLAEMLDAQGFWCAGFLGSAALTKRTGMDQGFDHWDEALDQPIKAGGNDQLQRRADALTDAILAHVKQTLAKPGAEEVRLFLFAQYFDPHAPYAPPVAARQRYGATLPAGGFGEIDQAVVEQQRRATGRSLGGQQGVIGRGLTSELVEGATGAATELGLELARLYAGEITFTDQEVGRLLLGLRSLGVLDEALVIVTADHGETRWEHGNAWNHGLWVSQTDVHVPLIMRLPSLVRSADYAPGTSVPTPVSGVDLMPTVLDLLGFAGTETGGGWEGRSLAPALAGQPMEDVPVFSEATQPGAWLEKPIAGNAALPWLGARKPSAVRLGDWKLIHAPYLNLEQLFHLRQDPGERHDRLAGDDAESRRMAGTLRAALADWRGSAAPKKSIFDKAQANGLAGLGYGDASPPK